MSKPSRNLAVVYKGPLNVVVQDVGYPKMVDPRGNPTNHAVIVKCIATNICGSDLHMYRGRTDVKPGIVFGHEITGEVFEVGSDVSEVKVGDIVSVPFNIACGRCQNCREQYTNACLTVNPQMPGGAYGYADMGDWQGGQAEYVLVPYADFQCCIIPKEKALTKMRDLAMLSDIFPTAFNAAVQARVNVGSSVYVAGAGPVGICCAASSLLLGAAVVIVGDPRPERLKLVSVLSGVVTIDLTKFDSNDSLAGEIERLTGKKEVDCSVDCVGYEACGLGRTALNNNEAESVLNTCFHVTKATGGVGIPGLYMPADPQGKTAQTKAGIIPMKFGVAWTKGLTIGMGQCPTMAYQRQLMMAILYDRVKLSNALNVKIITIEEAPEAYKKFNEGEAIKYVIAPHGHKF